VAETATGGEILRGGSSEMTKLSWRRLKREKVTGMNEG
jgi:hypothetical protein